MNYKMAREYIPVSFDDKNEAKAMGAWWDGGVKKWYIPDWTSEEKAKALRSRWCRKPTAGDRSARASKAARNEIYYQTHAFRISNGYGAMSFAHVGHVGERRFVDLFADFCKLKGISPGDINIRIGLIQPSKVNEGELFEDVELAAAWHNYHRTHAMLKMQTALDNLREEPDLSFCQALRLTARLGFRKLASFVTLILTAYETAFIGDIKDIFKYDNCF